jgi:hypothetical protein
VVFNFPEGDTVILEMQTQSYYGIVASWQMSFRKGIYVFQADIKDAGYYKSEARSISAKL